jgi:hypothetical protein
MNFDDTVARQRLRDFWELGASFGMERGRLQVYLNEIVSDRYQLVKGLQLLRDELMFADPKTAAHAGDVARCAADLTVPTVVTTMAYTNCGDRIHQGEVEMFRKVVAARFATVSELGDLKLESFSPTGGGTDDGATLAHVTVAHQLDESLRERIYAGNPSSFVLVGIDLKTHVGRLDGDERMELGRTRESMWREPRTACGAIVGTLSAYNPDNAVHRRLRSDLGEENFELLRSGTIKTREGIDMAPAVAAAIVAVQGMLNTASALAHELDARGVAHLTASTTVNRTSRDDTVLYLARATVFMGEVKVQGFGTDATQYGGELVRHDGDSRLRLVYEGHEMQDFPVETSPYSVRYSRFDMMPAAGFRSPEGE